MFDSSWITAGGASPLHFVALALIILAWLSTKWFSADGITVRLSIFAILFFGIGIIFYFASMPLPTKDKETDAASEEVKVPIEAVPDSKQPTSEYPIQQVKPKRDIAPPVVAGSTSFGSRPPPPEPTRLCSPGPYIVFFEWGHTRLPSDATPIVDSAIAAYRNCGNARVEIRAISNRTDNDDQNEVLAERAAMSVLEHMAQGGVPRRRIFVDGMDDLKTSNRVLVADGVREPQFRRVEIVFLTS